MTARLNALRRIVAARTARHMMMQAHLRLLDNKLAALERARMELMAGVNDNIAAHGHFVDLLAAGCRKIDRELADVVSSRQKFAAQMMDEARRLKLAERLAQEVALLQQREAERRELALLIDEMMARDAARLR